MDRLIEKIFKPAVGTIFNVIAYFINIIIFGFLFYIFAFLLIGKIVDPVLNAIIPGFCEGAALDCGNLASGEFSIALIIGLIGREILGLFSELFESLSGWGEGDTSGTQFVVLALIFWYAVYRVHKIFPELKSDNWIPKLKTKVMKSIFKDYKEPEKKD